MVPAFPPRNLPHEEIRPLDPVFSVNTVETYVQLDDAGRREYAKLLTQEPTQEVRAMEMTWADKLEARGREQGHREGRLEGMRALLLGLMEHRFTTIPAETRKAVQATTSPDELARLADRVIDARSLDDLGL